eukprot:5818526-Amphidinium_carterae.1
MSTSGSKMKDRRISEKGRGWIKALLLGRPFGTSGVDAVNTDPKIMSRCPTLISLSGKAQQFGSN